MLAQLTEEVAVRRSHCQTCGTGLNGGGQCLACLLHLGLEAAAQPELDKNEVAPVCGDFEIARREDGSLWELGRGGMGVTYRAIDGILRRPVALKVIRVPGEPAKAPAIHERFLREARGAAGLHHPNVAEVYQFGTSPEMGRAYIAMELIDGETMEERVRRDGPFSAETALEISIQVARALVAAADRGLVHRDLKPGNIMLSPGDSGSPMKVTVIDFGLAKAIAGTEDAMKLTHGGFVGTPAFASPEQFRGEPADARSDIYSSGATLWYALTGGVPFSGRSIEEIGRAQREEPLPVGQLVLRRIPWAVIALLRRILSVTPADRPPSARAFLLELERCRAAAAGASRQRRLTPAAGLAAAAIVTAIAGLVAAHLRSSGGAPDERFSPDPARPPTDSAPAYEAYVEGLALNSRAFGEPTAEEKAAKAFAEAVRLDPSFALAWAHLSAAQSDVYWAQHGPAQELAESKRALDTAARLEPDLGEVYLARGFYHYHGERNYDAAIRDFTQATQRLPNSANGFMALGLVQRRQGVWEKALLNFAQAARIDPLNPAYFDAWHSTSYLVGRYAEARAILEHELVLMPGDPRLLILKAQTYQFEGDLAAAGKLLATVPLQPVVNESLEIQLKQWFYERQYQRVIDSCRFALAQPDVPTDGFPEVLIDVGFCAKVVRGHCGWDGHIAGGPCGPGAVPGGVSRRQ